jgi:hypothetical protein
MSTFGVSTDPRPRRIDELISSELMAKLNQVDVMSRKIFAGKLQGERRSKKRGISVEFADYRHYTHGDDLRFVDWNIYARLDKLFIKMFLEEEDLSVILADRQQQVDGLGQSQQVRLLSEDRHGDGVHRPGEPESCHPVFVQLERSVAPAEPSRQAAGAGDGLMAAEARTGRRQRLRQRHALHRADAAGQGRDDHPLGLHVQGRVREGLRYLCGGGYDTYCMQVLAPEEVDPAKAGLTGDLRLTDIEDDDSAEVTVTGPLLRKYKENLNAYCGKLRDFCVRRGMTHMTIDTKTEISALLLDYMRKRGLLR